MNTADFITALFEPLGDNAPVKHTLIVDYTTEDGEECHGEFFPMVPPGTAMEAVAWLIVEEMARLRCTVSAVFELLDGYTCADAERVNAAELADHVRVLYNRADHQQPQ